MVSAHILSLVLVERHQVLKRLRVKCRAMAQATPAYKANTPKCNKGWLGHLSKNNGLTNAMAWLRGNHSATARTQGGNWSLGKNTPLKNIMGVKNKVK